MDQGQDSEDFASDHVSPEDHGLALSPLEDDNCWPRFPPGYFDDVGRAHGRWGFPSKSYKYAVDRYEVPDHKDFARSWVEPRMQQWIEDRRLEDKIVFSKVGNLPGPAYSTNPWFVEYAYKPNERRHRLGASGASLNTQTVYHGTSFSVLARILHTNRLHASNVDLSIGMENRYDKPAVFTAETLDHALTYAWPCSALKDNLYYKVVLQCEIAQPAVMQRRKGEVLVKEGHVLIRNVLIFSIAPFQKDSRSALTWTSYRDWSCCLFHEADLYVLARCGNLHGTK